MAKEKKVYKITRIETHDFGDGNIQAYKKEWIRPAVSEAQAIARMKYINGDNKYNMVHEWRGDGARIITYEAQEVEQ